MRPPSDLAVIGIRQDLSAMAGIFLRILLPSALAVGARSLLLPLAHRFFAFAIAILDKKVLGF